MRTALAETGEILIAAETTAKTAICPDCGGTVILRKRRLMGGGFTYFWRHQDNRRLHCQNRSKPVK